MTELLVANEGPGTPTSDNRRWLPIYGFPYSLIYRSLQPGIRILVVRRLYRDPEYGAARR